MPPIDPSSLNTSIPAPAKNKDDASLTGATQSMGKDQFLKLLTTQLKNQDPLEPQKNHEFVAQLAQFSGLEQQISANDNLKAMLASQNTMVNGQISSMIGKQIVSRGDTLNIQEGVAQNIDFELGGSAATVDVTIYNEAGQTVATQKFNSLGGGSHSMPWNNRDSEGKVLPDGRYRFSIKATDQSGQSVSADSMTRGIVSGITFEKGKPELIVGKARVLPDQILKIVDPNHESGPAASQSADPGSGSTDGAGSESAAPPPSTQAARQLQARNGYRWGY